MTAPDISPSAGLRAGLDQPEAVDRFRLDGLVAL
jgi:hypothetical protein